MHLVLCLGGLSLLPLDLGPARGVGVPLGFRMGRAGSLPLLLHLREEEERELPASCRRPFPTSLMLSTLPNSHRTFHDVGIRGSRQHLAPACYPPAVPDLRIVDRGRIRGLGHVRVARVDVAVALALAPLPVRGQEVESWQWSSSASLSSRARSRRERSRSFDRYRSWRGSSRSRRDRSRSSDRYRSRRERSRSVDRYRSRRQRTRSPARRGERRDRSRSPTLPSRSHDRSRSGGRLPGSPARLRAEEPGRLARRETQEGVEAVASQPPVVSGAAAGATPVAGGASITALPSVVEGLARFFMGLSSSSSLGALADIAGVTASAAASGGAVCPATTAGGAATICAAAVTPAGAGVLPASPAAVPGVSGEQQRPVESRSRGRRSRSSSDGTDRQAKK